MITAPDTAAPAPPVRAPGRVSRVARHAATAALLTWLILTPIAMALPSAVHADPFLMRGVMLPIAAGGLVLAAAFGLAVAFGRPGLVESLAGVSAGAYAAWIALTLRTMLNGTPFGFAGLSGDMVRMSAMATRYTATSGSADGIVAGVPSEYPPLYPWLIGRVAVLTHMPAWRLLGEAEVLTTSAAILAAFLMWRRLVSAPVALALAAVSLAAFGDPRKAYEIITLTVFVPWVFATFGGPPRGRLHWLPAGLIGGVIVVTFQGYLTWGALGILAFAAMTWRAEGRAYLRHVGATVLVMAAVASWYLGPYVWALVRHGGQMVSDLYVAEPNITDNPFPFLAGTPLGVLESIGLIGIVWYRRATWWAPPLICLLAGTYVYRAFYMLRFVIDGHTGLYYRTTRLIAVLLAVAGVLTLVRAVPALAGRLGAGSGWPRGVGATILAAVLCWTGLTYWQTWRPNLTQPNYTTLAHAEPLPNGRRPEFAAGPVIRWFPVPWVRAEVQRVLGPGAAPRTLSFDERLFAYLPWPGYVAVDRTAAGSPTRWDDRHAALVRLAAVTDPAAFAQASTRTAFGRIDLFVLRTNWSWGTDVQFHREQFDPSVFAIVTDRPDHTVLAIRRTATSGTGRRAPVAARRPGN